MCDGFNGALLLTLTLKDFPFLNSDTRVVPSNIVLDRSPGPPQEGEIWGRIGDRNTSQNSRCKLWTNHYR